MQSGVPQSDFIGLEHQQFGLVCEAIGHAVAAGVSACPLSKAVIWGQNWWKLSSSDDDFKGTLLNSFLLGLLLLVTLHQEHCVRVSSEEQVVTGQIVYFSFTGVL